MIFLLSGGYEFFLLKEIKFILVIFYILKVNLITFDYDDILI